MKNVRDLTRALKEKPRVPFIPNMDRFALPTLSEGYALPLTAEVFGELRRRCRPMGRDRDGFFVRDAVGRLSFFFEDASGDFFGVLLSSEESAAIPLIRSPLCGSA